MSLVVIFFELPLIDHVSLLILLIFHPSTMFSSIIYTFVHIMDDLVSFTILHSLYLVMVNSPPLAIDSTFNVCLSLGIEPTIIKFTTNIFHVQFLKMILSYGICILGYNLQSSTLGNLVMDSNKCDVIGNMMWTQWELKPTLPQRKKIESLSCILFNLIVW